MHQGLCGLWEGVGDAVAEALSQAGPAGGDGTAPGSQRGGAHPGPPPLPPRAPSSHLFWMDLASQPLWPTIWVMFLASHQALLSGNSASLLMGGGAASSMAGRTAPTRTLSIVPVASEPWRQAQEAGEGAGEGRQGPGAWRGAGTSERGSWHLTPGLESQLCHSLTQQNPARSTSL